MPTFKNLFRARPKYVTVRPPAAPDRSAEQAGPADGGEKVVTGVGIRAEAGRAAVGDVDAAPRRDIPDGLWVKCDQCAGLVYTKEMERNAHVCPKCGRHYKMSARSRLDLLLDQGTITELWGDLTPLDPLQFPTYPDKLARAQARTGLKDAAVAALGLLDGYRVVVAALDFEFIGGSMGSVVGEKVTRSVEYAIDRGLPVITVATSGGARMQEGILSLMQMAKTCAALGRADESGILHVSVLADPCTAGVMASFASVGDVIIAEPGALVAFAGPRVIEQTVREKLPPGAHRAEFVQEHGFVDIIVERRDLKRTIARLLTLHGLRREA